MSEHENDAIGVGRRAWANGVIAGPAGVPPAWNSGEMTRRHRIAASGVRRSQRERLRQRQRWYFALMGACLVLILLAWNLVRLWSTTAAVVMSIIAAVIPPIAVIIANWGEGH